MRLATLLLSLLICFPAAAQRPDTTYTLEAVSVTGSRIPTVTSMAVSPSAIQK